jgi:transposase
MSAPLRKRQEGISKEVRDISWRAQQRLCSRLTHFTNSGKSRNKAIVALARELAGFIWSLGQVSQLLA